MSLVPGGRAPFGRDGGESPAIRLQASGITGEGLPALDRDVDILRHELNGVAGAVGDLGRDDRRTGAAERLVHRLPRRGVVLDRALHALDWLLSHARSLVPRGRGSAT